MAKIQFGAVYLDHEVDRMGGQGLASASTTYFKAAENVTQQVHAPRTLHYSIELDTATGLVTITGERGSIVVPRERVKRFEPLPVPKTEEASPAKK